MKIYKNKKTDRLYVFVEFVNYNESRYLNLEDKYTYTIPDEDMDFWCNDESLKSYKTGDGATQHLLGMGRLYKIDINIDVVEKLNDVDYGDRISYDDIKAALDKMNLGK
jgi:hypothetical protein